MEATSYYILVASALLLASILTSFAAARFGTPLLLIFLVVGLLAGEDGLGLVYNDAGGAFLIGSVALAVILFESGLDTRIQSYRLAAAPALALATAGTAITTGVLGVATHWIMGLPWAISLLFGAVMSSTDAAALFFLLRVGGITIRDRVRSTLEIESGTNDPMAILLTIVLVEAAKIGIGDPTDMAMMFAREIGLGALAGLVGGLLLARVINRIRIDPGLTPVTGLVFALFIFAGTNVLGGSGFLAVYASGVIAGNLHLRGALGLKRFHSGLAWLGQIVMFVILGLLATPSQFWDVLAPGIVLGVILILVARPLAVVACLMPFRFSANEQAFVGWVGLRGAVSLLLAIMPLTAGLTGGRTIFNLAYVVVILSLLVQGWTIRRMATWLHLIVPRRTGPVDRVELELPGDADLDLVSYVVHPKSSVAKGQRPPVWARPSVVIRDGHVVAPHHRRFLQANDRVYVFAARPRIPLLDRLYGGARPIDQDDRAFFGDLVLAPDAMTETVATMYDLTVENIKPGLTLAELFRYEFGDAVEPGDRMRFGPVELIARDVDETGTVQAIGMALEPTDVGLARINIKALRQNISTLASRWINRLGL